MLTNLRPLLASAQHLDLAATRLDTVKIMIRLDWPPEKTHTHQSGVDTTWNLNICDPVGRTDCR